MAVTARPMSRPSPTVRPGGRPPVRPARAAARSTPAKVTTTADTLRIAVLVVAAAIAAVIGIAVIWEFGVGRNLPMLQRGSATDGLDRSQRDAPTTVYRDLHNGRIMVMEYGPDGTRLKGTVDRSTVPTIGEMANEPSTRGSSEPSASDRVNALGSAFR